MVWAEEQELASVFQLLSLWPPPFTLLVRAVSMLLVSSFFPCDTGLATRGCHLWAEPAVNMLGCPAHQD